MVQDGRDLVGGRRGGVSAQVDRPQAQVAQPGQRPGAVLGVDENPDAARAVGGGSGQVQRHHDVPAGSLQKPPAAMRSHPRASSGVNKRYTGRT